MNNLSIVKTTLDLMSDVRTNIALDRERRADALLQVTVDMIERHARGRDFEAFRRDLRKHFMEILP